MAEYGMIAKDNIKEGEILFTIPRSLLLHQGTSKVSTVLDKGGYFVSSITIHTICCLISEQSPSRFPEKKSLESSSGWVPLLLALLYEYTYPQSHWKSYLSLWTDFKTLDHPMFW